MQEYQVRVYDNGTVEWFQNGLYHRDGGPAREFSNGLNEWFQKGLLHREDGPAIIQMDGTKCYFLNGMSYSEEMYIKKIAENSPLNTPVNDYQKLAKAIEELSKLAKTLNTSIMLYPHQQHTPSQFKSWDMQNISWNVQKNRYR